MAIYFILETGASKYLLFFFRTCRVIEAVFQEFLFLFIIYLVTNFCKNLK